MKILLKSVKIFDKTSKYHLKKMDVLIESGVLVKIAKSIPSDDSYKVFEQKRACVSPGWIDTNFHIFEPGSEYREDFKSGLKAAANGGYTKVCLMPNTNPPMDNSTSLAFASNASKHALTDVLSLGAVSQGIKGKDIAEIYDMHQHGAVAFTDGSEPILDAGLMERALWYVKKFDGLVMSHPDNKDISHKGQMNEGLNSTKLGLEGVPKLAEELMVSRDIYLLEHTNSRLHFTNVSTKKSVDLIRKAKKKGLKLTAGVNVANLILDDSSILTYDTNYKVSPHLREKEDIKALLKGLSDGTIDVIASGHTPLHIDEKKVEFGNAEFGISTIDCAFQVARKATAGVLSDEDFIDKFVKGYSILNYSRPRIEEGVRADFTLFELEEEQTLALKDVHSKGKNNPFVGMKLQGKVLGLIKGTKTRIN